MKKQLLIKTSLLLVALFGGASVSWAANEATLDGAGTVYGIPTIQNNSTTIDIASGNPITCHYATLYRSDGNDTNILGTSPDYYIDGIKGGSYITFNLNNSNTEATPVEFHFRGATSNDGVSVTISISDRDGSNAVEQVVAITNKGGWDPISGGDEFEAYFASVGTGEKLLKITYNGTYTSWIASLGAFSIKKVAAKTNKTLTIQSNNEEYGKVSSTPDAGSIATGTSVTLTANREWGCDFINWTNFSTSEVLSPNKSYTFSLNEDITIQGNFRRRTTTQEIPAVTTLDPEVVTKTGGSFKEVTFQGNTVTSFDNFRTGNKATFALNNTLEQFYKIVAYTANDRSQQSTSSLIVTLKDKDNKPIGTESFDTAGDGWGDWIERSFVTSEALPVGAATLELAFTNVNVVSVKMIAPTAVALNESLNYTPEEKFANVTLTRTITADKWSTIVLPFALTSEQITSAFGKNVIVAELTDKSTEEVLKFSTVTAMNANQPYAIKVKDGEYSGSATISGVTIVEGTSTQTVNGSWNFVGTYTSGNIPLDSYFFNSNKLYRAADNTNTIKPFRAYFTPNGELARELKFIIDGDDTTSIGTIKADGTMETTAEGTVYNLSGQRVNKPAKGLYVINGKKVIIK